MLLAHRRPVKAPGAHLQSAANVFACLAARCGAQLAGGARKLAQYACPPHRVRAPSGLAQRPLSRHNTSCQYMQSRSDRY